LENSKKQGKVKNKLKIGCIGNERTERREKMTAPKSTIDAP